MNIFRFLPVLITSLSLPLLAAPPLPPAPPAPLPAESGSWGNYVYIYTPASPSIQTDMDAVFAQNGGPNNNGEFINQGYAFLFTPGTYNVNVQLGYYTSIMGLGQIPSATIVNFFSSPESNSDPCIGSLYNYWRSAENLQTQPGNNGMTWAASHGSYFRSIQVFGRLVLSGNGASTGAFLANCNLQTNDSMTSFTSSAVFSKTQQQLLVRNSNMEGGGGFAGWSLSSPAGFAWAQTFLGCTNAPASRCGNCNDPQIPGESTVIETTGNTKPRGVVGCTCRNFICPEMPFLQCKGVPASNIAQTPRIAEKPFITFDTGVYNLRVPDVMTNSAGVSNYSSFSGTTIPFAGNVYVATISDTVDTINAMLASKQAVILTPGTYSLSSPLLINKAGTILLGIGYPILVANNIQGCIQVGDVSGVRIGGLILEAGPISDALLTWGTNQTSQNGFLYDCFGRVGQFTPSATCNFTEQMFVINSSDIVLDNVWAWRLPDAVCTNNSFLSGSGRGFLIQGQNVIGYGLTSENMFGVSPTNPGNLLEWNGNNGQCYSFQGIFPADGKPLPNDVYGATGYLVNTSVTNHRAYDIGVYSRLQSERPITVLFGISSPDSLASLKNPGIKGIAFSGAFTRILSGNAIINNVINNNGYNSGTQENPQNAVSDKFPGPAYTDGFCVWGTTSTLKEAFQTNAGR